MWPLNVSYFTTGSPVRNAELTTTNQKNLVKVQRRDETPVQMSYKPPRLLTGVHFGWVTCTTRKDPESEWLARDSLETNRIIIKPETEPRAEFSWVPFPWYCPSRNPFPTKPLALSACVSLDNWFFFFFLDNWFLSVGQESNLGLWKGSSFLQQN